MHLHHRPIKVVITGKSGSGKTTYFERLLLNGFKSYWQTIFLYDWQGEMAERLQVQPIFQLDQIPERLESGFVCYDPSVEFESDAETGLLCFSRIAFELSKNDDYSPGYPRLLACDEIQQLIGNDSMPPEIKSVMQTGRRAGLDLACVSQQLNEMHNTFRSQTTERVTFQHEDPYVLQVIGQWGFDREEVALLGVGEYIYKNDKGIVERGSLFGIKKTVDQDPETEDTESTLGNGSNPPESRTVSRDSGGQSQQPTADTP